ncbi:MAG: DUF2202 domain-containing protein [Tetrasphaera sp.]
MSTSRTRTVLAVVAVVGTLGVGGAAVAANSPAGPVSSSAVSAADTQLAAKLAFNREEERMARDLYRVFSDKYDAALPFSRVVYSEQRHFEAVGRLLTAYGISDPSAGRAPGSYADPTLQSLYNGWKAQGLKSRTEAAKAGVALENRDIADLQKTIASVSQQDLKRVLSRLLAASRNHLAAFTDAADGTYSGAMGAGPAGTHHGSGPGLGGGAAACDGTGAGMGGGPGVMGGRGPGRWRS